MERIEDALKKLILDNYKSLREFSIEIEMPYSTLDSVLKRGILKSNVSNIITICQALNIDTDALAHGKLQPRMDYEIQTIAAHHEGEEWTPEELEEIERYKEFVRMRKKNNK